MPLIKRKRCCVPHCPNIPELSKKQFFKIGANLEARNKWRVDKMVIPKSQLLYCCEDHFDLPNDAVNYIRYKYYPNTKLKLRPDTLPHKKLPLNVCRLCLNLIYNGDDLVDISEDKGGENARIVATLLPEIDLSITVEPVVCMKCFDPLERYYKIKHNILRSEIVIVNCIKSIVKRSPRRLIRTCEIDLFDEYNDIKTLLDKEKQKEKDNAKLIQEPTINSIEEMIERKRELQTNDEEIVIQVEDQEEAKYHIVEVVPMKDNSSTETPEHEFEAGDPIDGIEEIADPNNSTEGGNTDMRYEIIQESPEVDNENVLLHLE